MKEHSFLVLFKMNGLDYEGISEEQQEEYCKNVRTALEVLPNEGAGFMVSNLLIRDTAKPAPLVDDPDARELFRFARKKKRTFLKKFIKNSYSNSILCGLRYYPVDEEEPGWWTCISFDAVHTFYADQVNASVNVLKQGYLSLTSALSAFSPRDLTRKESYEALYELINFSPASESENEIRRGDALLVKGAKARKLLHLGYTVQQIAVTFGVSRQAVDQWLAAEELPEPIKQAVEAGEIKASAALQMARHAREEQVQRFEDIKKNGIKPTVHTMRSAAEAADNQPAPKMKTRKEILHKMNAVAAEGDEEWRRAYVSALLWVLGKEE